MYFPKDISIIIPTYNRATDIQTTLKKILINAGEVREVLIIDQSKNNLTRNTVKEIKSKKVRYIYSSIPAITIARNKGIKNTSRKSKIILFIDDDVTISKNFIKNILNVFNENKNALAVGAFNVKDNLQKMGKIEIFARKIFFLSYPESNKARIISAYGNTFPGLLNKVINVEWLPGVNMAYKKEVFTRQQFDENLLGYTVAEDIDFSYRLFKKYNHSLFMTPFASFKHRASQVERSPTEKMVYINQVDHFYFFFKNLDKNFSNRVKFLWVLTGIFLLRSAKFFKTKKEEDYHKVRFFINSIFYCISNLSLIKRGILRKFLP